MFGLGEATFAAMDNFSCKIIRTLFALTRDVNYRGKMPSYGDRTFCPPEVGTKFTYILICLYPFSIVTFRFSAEFPV